MIQFAECLCHLQNSVVAVPGGYGMQAVALRIAGNKAMFYRVRIWGTQDTLLDDYSSHYFSNAVYKDRLISFSAVRDRSIRYSKKTCTKSDHRNEHKLHNTHKKWGCWTGGGNF